MRTSLERGTSVFFVAHFPLGKGNSLFKKYSRMLPYASIKFRGTDDWYLTAPAEEQGERAAVRAHCILLVVEQIFVLPMGHIWKLWKGTEIASS